MIIMLLHLWPRYIVCINKRDSIMSLSAKLFELKCTRLKLCIVDATHKWMKIVSICQIECDIFVNISQHTIHF